MPIRREFRSLYPADWPAISHGVRFDRAGGRCEDCGRPHGRRVRVLRDGRWCDPEEGTWRGRDGLLAPWPDVEDYARVRSVRVVLAACHRDHDPRNNDDANLAALCQACHLRLDRRAHRAQFRLTILLRRALGDLFDGPYLRRPGVDGPLPA
jgi:hypothetical protein